MLLRCFCLCVLFLKVWAADRKSLPYPGGIPSPPAKFRLQGKRVKAASPSHRALEEGFSSLPIETKHRGVFGLKENKENKQARRTPKEEGGESRCAPLLGWEGWEPGMRKGQVGMQLSSPGTGRMHRDAPCGRERGLQSPPAAHPASWIWNKAPDSSVPKTPVPGACYSQCRRPGQGDVLSRHSRTVLALEENRNSPPPLPSALPPAH